MTPFIRLLLLMSLIVARLLVPSCLQAAQPAPLELVDSRGKLIRLEHKAQRIASACLSADEILWELLQEAGEIKRLVAVSYLADDPSYSNIAELVKSVPGRVGTSIESLLALKPDLVVLASYNRPELIKSIEEAGIATYVLASFASFADIEAHIRNLARLSSLPELGEKQAAAMRQSIDALRVKWQTRAPAAKPRILNWNTDGTVAGAGTLFQALVTQAEGRNPAADLGLQGWSRLSWEVLAGLDADWLVVAAEESERSKVLEAIRKSPAYGHMTASKKAQLILVPPRQINAVSLHLLKALQRIGESVHP